MKFLKTVVAILLISYLLGFLLPWWAPAVAAFLVALILPQKAGISFLSGFVGVGLYWLLHALISDLQNEHILSLRMAALFGLPGTVSFLVVTTFLGAIIGGLSAWAASLIMPSR